MTEYVHPDNPFPVSDNFKSITPFLVNAAIETFAFIGAPVCVSGLVPAELIVEAAQEWTLRATGLGGEDASHALVWELSVATKRLADTSAVPFTPFDITSRCDDDECDVNHAAQTCVVNAFFASSCAGQHSEAVRHYISYVHQDGAEYWTKSRVHYAAMLLVHVAQRVCDYRTNSVEELPTLG